MTSRLKLALLALKFGLSAPVYALALACAQAPLDDLVQGKLQNEVTDEFNSKEWETPFFPLLDQARWVYRRETSEGDIRLRTVLLNENADDPHKYTVELETLGAERIQIEEWQRVGAQLQRTTRTKFRSGQQISETQYRPGFTRFNSKWITRGQTQTHEHQRTVRDEKGESVEDRAYEFFVLTLEGRASVVAGEFSDCLVIERRRDESITRTWYAPEVGIVLELGIDDATREELIDVDLP